jgi:hypothetical protein
MILAVEEIAEPLHGDGDRDCSYRRARH